MTPHINAKDNEIAKYVLMPGDPLRAKYIAENYLKNVKLVSNVRNIFMYTGDYQGNKVSICASGMGIPSIGIYAYELYNFYGVEAIVRVGSAGSYEENLKLYDLVLASSCYGENVSFRKAFNLPQEHLAYPNAKINLQIENSAKKLNIDLKTLHIHSEDAFYTNENAQARKARSNNAACVEMESYGLFTIAEKLNKKAACILTISDNLVTKEYTTSDEREKSFNKMMELALSIAKDYQ
ncbi:purine-nucleoside phosphorylase [Mycoplasma miroungirhinis]|uniref:Uridine phosphorylase n=2 Tax=Mycoplasma miroungirhinis TaxID=754516 RepID=A0A6M4JEN1_9MOLU|nr:purine-nucleoside phosphorylase [Mycoplasma miroungirhinis]QJR44449.1 purine-nucleoside phosphorylase [Mycoplasma miroungirhinis]